MSDESDSNGRDQIWGTIFTAGGERNINSVGERSRAWSPEDEAAYLARVRERAERMAQGMLAEAKAEAERLKAAASEEGYKRGIAIAEAELDEFRSGMTQSVSAVLEAIEGQCSHIFEQWREDLVGLTRLAVEKISGIEMSAERRAMLEALLVDSVGLLEKRRELVIRVNPEDEPMVSDIVDLTRERFPDVSSWRVRADAGISAGGIVVESESSLAEGRVESRKAAVDEILARLTLPDHPEETEPE